MISSKSLPVEDIFADLQIQCPNYTQAMECYHRKDYFSAALQFTIAGKNCAQPDVKLKLKFNYCLVLLLQREWHRALQKLAILHDLEQKNQEAELEVRILNAAAYCLLRLKEVEEFKVFYQTHEYKMRKIYGEIYKALQAENRQVGLNKMKRSFVKKYTPSQILLKNLKRKSYSPPHSKRMGKTIPTALRTKYPEESKKRTRISQTEAKLKQYLKKFRGQAQPTNKAEIDTSKELYAAKVEQYIENMLFPSIETFTPQQVQELNDYEREIIKECFVRKELNNLAPRELGLLDKIVSRFQFFSKFESDIRKEILSNSKYIIISGGRKVGSAMAACSKEEFDDELLEMLGDDILEIESDRAYIFLNGKMTYVASSRRSKNPILMKNLVAGNIFFSESNNIERTITREVRELQHYLEEEFLEQQYEINAYAIEQSEILEISISRFQELMTDLIEKQMRERVHAMRKNELLGQLSHNCLIELAFKVEVVEKRFGEFIIKQKEMPNCCFIILKGECEVVYANVLDTPSIRDFKKYKRHNSKATRVEELSLKENFHDSEEPISSAQLSQKRTLSSKLSFDTRIQHFTPEATPSTRKIKNSLSKSSVKFGGGGQENKSRRGTLRSSGLLDRDEESSPAKLKFSFWDNKKMAELREGHGTGYLSFISNEDALQELQKSADTSGRDLILLHPIEEADFSLVGDILHQIGKSANVKIIKITPHHLVELRRHSKEVKQLLSWYSRNLGQIRDLLFK